MAASVVAAVLLVLLAAPALAAPEPRALGELPIPVLSDGARFVTWSDGSTVRVIDTRERRSFLVDVPAGCFYSAVGGGELLFSCATSPSPEPPYGPRYLPLLYSLERGEFHWPVEVETLLRQQGEETFYVTFRDVGRHWIAFEESDGYHVTTPYLYEWHDGRTELRNPKEAGRARSVVDLDEADAFARMCKPLRREENPYARPDDYPDEQPYYDYMYVEPFGLGSTAGYYTSPFLQRCGSRKRRQLTASRTYVAGITRRVAYWTEGYTLYVRVLRSGRLLAYDFSEGRPAESAGFSIAGSAKRLYVEVGESGETVTALPGYVLRTPRR